MKVNRAYEREKIPFLKWTGFLHRKGLAFLFVAALLLLTGAAPAMEPIEINAPGGGEFDFQTNVAKYYADGSKLVEAYWVDDTFIAEYIEVNRDLQTVHGRGQAKITQSSGRPWELLCNEFNYERRRDYLIASGAVHFHTEKDGAFSGGRFEWDRKNDLFKLEEQPEAVYQGWVIHGSRMDGKIVKGLLNVSGPAEATDGDLIAKGGQMVLNRETNKLVIQVNPVVIRGANEMTAKEITYDWKTKKVTAIGPVKSRIINEADHPNNVGTTKE